MVKVECILKYFDKKLDKEITPKDEPFEVTEERAAQLVDAKVCRIIEVIPEEQKEEKAEKKAAKKSKKK